MRETLPQLGIDESSAEEARSGQCRGNGRRRNEPSLRSHASSRPCTSAGGAVASTAVKGSIIVYWCLAPAGTNQESPAFRFKVWLQNRGPHFPRLRNLRFRS